MAVRSEIINKAFSRIVSGENDPLWLNEERNDFFHEAVDLVFEAITDAELPFYRKTSTLTKNSDNRYPVPSDFYAAMRVEDGTGFLYLVEQNDEIERNREGFRFFNGNIELVNYSGTAPATLTLEYIHFPKDMGTWNGDDDDLDADVGTDDTDPAQPYVPDYPLNGPRGARVLAKVIYRMARSKDESETQATMEDVAVIISNFVDRLGTINRTEPYITRARQ